jgi:hypothetical protein
LFSMWCKRIKPTFNVLILVVPPCRTYRSWMRTAGALFAAASRLSRAFWEQHMKSTGQRFSLFLLGLAACASAAIAQNSGSFTATGRLITPRAGHTATLLANGMVLLAGGDSAYYFSHTEASAELYDPGSGTFAATGMMTTPRTNHTSTLLPNGKVLIAGGGPTTFGATYSLASAELYDPATGKFTATGNMTEARSQHNATLLKNGKVLITGGNRLVTYPFDVSFSTTAELYDPATGTFAPAGTSGAFCDTATLLPDGRVLITRRDPDQDRVSHAELYDSSTAAFVNTGDMNSGHTRPAAILLTSGKVLIAGGDIGDIDGASVSAELYDPANGKFTSTGNLITGRERTVATLLPDGTVLFAGGYGVVSVPGGYDNLASAEIYDLSTGKFSDAGAMLKGRDVLGATLLKDGRVLITGGNEYYMPWAAGSRDFVYPAVPVAELFTPSSMAPAPGNSASVAPGTFTAAGFMTTARAGHSATLLLDGRVLIVGGDQTGTAELYDPATGIFTPAGNGTTGHGGTATLLPDGRVLIAGGSNWELYDPSTGSFTPAGSLSTGAGGFTATLLTTGNVLFMTANPELYDPSTGLFTLAGSCNTMVPPTNACSGGSTATLLADGKVLIASPAATLYDPVANTFNLTGSKVFGDQVGGPTATLMTNGKVLVAGGNPEGDDFYFLPTNDSELYEPSTGRFSLTASMYIGRYNHTSTLLPDGTVLITGGITDSWYTAPPLAEPYDPSTGTFLAPIVMKASRSSHQATLLNDGRVLITGGLFTGPYSIYTPMIHSSAELFTPAVLVPAPALLSLSGDGQGQGAIQHAGTDRIASASDPAVAGEYLAIYLTGLADGSVIPPQVTIGGRMAEVSFFGKTPGYASLYQVNVRVPSGVTPGGAVPVHLIYVGRTSNEVTIGVR